MLIILISASLSSHISPSLPFPMSVCLSVCPSLSLCLYTVPASASLPPSLPPSLALPLLLPLPLPLQHTRIHTQIGHDDLREEQLQRHSQTRGNPHFHPGPCASTVRTVCIRAGVCEPVRLCIQTNACMMCTVCANPYCRLLLTHGRSSRTRKSIGKQKVHKSCELFPEPFAP